MASDVSSSGMSSSDKLFIQNVIMPLNKQENKVNSAASQAGDPNYTNPGTTDAPDDDTDVRGW